jgi:hypothetical protein
MNDEWVGRGRKMIESCSRAGVEAQAWRATAQSLHAWLRPADFEKQVLESRMKRWGVVRSK